MKKEENKTISEKKLRRMKRKKRNLIITICVIATVLVIGAIVYFIGGTAGKGSDTAKDSENKKTSVDYSVKADKEEAEEAFNSTASNSNKESLSTDVPAPDNLDVNAIAGFVSEGSESEGSESEGSIEVAPGSISLPYSVPETPFIIESIGSYTGAFVEDGSNKPVENILSMVITNSSDTMAQYGEIKLKVNDEEVLFKVTNLPAGTSALIIDTKGEKQFNKGDIYQYVSSMYSEVNGEVSLLEDKLKIGTMDNKIIIKNTSKEDLGTVYVYYKYVQEGGVYLGGITFRTKFENVKPGAELEAVAGHFIKSGSSIMMVDSIKTN